MMAGSYHLPGPGVESAGAFLRVASPDRARPPVSISPATGTSTSPGASVTSATGELVIDLTGCHPNRGRKSDTTLGSVTRRRKSHVRFFAPSDCLAACRCRGRRTQARRYRRWLRRPFWRQPHQVGLRVRAVSSSAGEETRRSQIQRRNHLVEEKNEGRGDRAK